MLDKNAYDDKTSFTQEEIAQLKTQYGQLTIITLTKKRTETENEKEKEKEKETPAEQHTFLFREPTRQMMSLATSRVSKTKNAGDYMEVIIDNTSLNGKNLLQRGTIYAAVQSKLDDLLTDFDAEVKKN